MRVSNLHHETAVKSLFHLQEIEPKLYNKLTKRISGIDMAGKMNKDNYFVKELPFMFKDWQEYRDYLIENLIKDPRFKKRLYSYRDRWDKIFVDDRPAREKCAKKIIQSVLANDLECVKLDNFRNSYVRLYQKDKERSAKKLAESKK